MGDVSIPRWARNVPEWMRLRTGIPEVNASILESHSDGGGRTPGGNVQIPAGLVNPWLQESIQALEPVPRNPALARTVSDSKPEPGTSPAARADLGSPELGSPEGGIEHRSSAGTESALGVGPGTAIPEQDEPSDSPGEPARSEPSTDQAAARKAAPNKRLARARAGSRLRKFRPYRQQLRSA